MKNEVLDRSMQVVKNLMKIEIKDRDKALKEKIQQYQNDGTLRVLQKRAEKILESEKSEIISNIPWLQSLVEVTQTAIYKIGSENIYSPEDQELSCAGKTLTDDSFIITASNVLYGLDLQITNSGFDISYSINELLMPWAENTRFKTYNYPLNEEDAAVFHELLNLREELQKLSDERCELKRKEEDMDELLLRVETDLLLKQIKADAIGESSIGTIKALMGKYLDDKKLPEGMNLIK